MHRLEDPLTADLTALQRQGVVHTHGPLLIVAGDGTGKTTVITRRIAWLLASKLARPEDILALTFTDKAAQEMEERVDVLVPYGYLDMWISTFHAFGDRLLREHAVTTGLSPYARVLSTAEQQVLLRTHLFDLPLEQFRPPQDPSRYVEALICVISRAKDEAVTSDAFLAYATQQVAKTHTASPEAQRQAALELELARAYQAYQSLLHHAEAMDFGDQMLLAIELLTHHPEILQSYQQRFRYILVDEFQDTNFAQFKLLQLLAAPDANLTVVCDDDQSIYKWRGAAISNVVKFLEHYQNVRRIVLTDNFRSSQAILDSAYRLIRHNDPDRLEVREGIDKRLVAAHPIPPRDPILKIFDTASSEADWVARQIDEAVQSGARQPGDFAILVRSNREADLFLRALNVCGVPWRFSGSTGLLARDDIKVLLSCLNTLADPDDSLSWYHVLSSPLYDCPMPELAACLAQSRRTHRSLRLILEAAILDTTDTAPLGEPTRALVATFLADVRGLVDQSRTLSPGQLLYRWLTDRGWLKRLAAGERTQDLEQLEGIARFFDQVRRCEELVGPSLPEFVASFALFKALGESPQEAFESSSTDRVNVLTLHKAKGLEFPVVFMVGLVQGRFPTPMRRDVIELPEALIQDLLPSGNYHLQEERRLFYVGMTRAKEELYLTAAYRYGGKTARKVSQFVLEALDLTTTTPQPVEPSHLDRIAQARPPTPAHDAASAPALTLPEPLRLDPHGLDDYLTCPLKFRFTHLLKIPVMRHHLVIYGAALHKAIEHFFKRVLVHQSMSEAELVETFEQAWISEGFLTREHEERRLEQGRAVLKRFFVEQQRHPEHPTLIEERFSIPLDALMIVGRWDRVDVPDGLPEKAVIIDYKSSDVSDQRQADRRTRESRQLAVYALAWHAIHGYVPARLELRFIETGVTGQAEVTTEDLEETRQLLRTAASGIRAGRFHAQPTEFACRWCAYQAICPSAFSFH